MIFRITGIYVEGKTRPGILVSDIKFYEIQMHYHN